MEPLSVELGNSTDDVLFAHGDGLAVC